MTSLSYVFARVEMKVQLKRAREGSREVIVLCNPYTIILVFSDSADEV